MISDALSLVLTTVRRKAFSGSAKYWDQRYAKGGTSGAGSYGRLAQFKADVLNRFVNENCIESVVELGCGDGNQLALFQFPRYLGVDVSPAAVARCRERHGADSTKAFRLASELGVARGQLALSLDVIYHLVEDSVFETYMRQLFAVSDRFVGIYSSDFDGQADSPHVRHRAVRKWVGDHMPEWELITVEKNPYPLMSDPENESFADFYFFGRRSQAARV